MCWPNLKSVPLPVSEIIEVPQKIWVVSGYAHLSKMFNGLVVRMDSVNVPAKFELR